MACHLPDLPGGAATPTHDKDITISAALLQPIQSVSVPEAVPPLHSLATSDNGKACFLAFVENPTNEEIFLETNYVLGTRLRCNSENNTVGTVPEIPIPHSMYFFSSTDSSSGKRKYHGIC